MKTILWLALAGVLSAVLTLVFEIVLLAAYPPTLDILSQEFLWVGLPAVVLVGLLIGLAFGRVLKRASIAQAMVYVLVYAGVHGAFMYDTLNSLDYRLIYLGLVVGAALLVVAWRRRSQ